MDPGKYNGTDVVQLSNLKANLAEVLGSLHEYSQYFSDPDRQAWLQGFGLLE